MANSSSTLGSNSTSKQLLQNLKTEVASSLNVTLKQGYNGDITARQAGSVGGQMVKNVLPVRSTSFERENRIVDGHKMTVRYIASLCA